MTSWEKAIDFVLLMEGGYTLDPNDPGGETNFGISKKSYPNLDIKNLTVETAKTIYKENYWNKCNCDNLPEAWAIAVFDMAVNQGAGKAIRTMQEALGVTTDGVVGPATVDAAAKAGARKLNLFLAHRLAEYAHLMAANNKLLTYAVNWSYRVMALSDILAA